MIDNSKITLEDVAAVAKSIGVVLTANEVAEVLRRYPHEQDNDPTGTWDLVVENIIYNIKEESI